MKVLIDNASSEIIEKKSRFIADLFFVSDVNDAEAKIEKIRKKYHDAKHHCFAYVIGEKANLVKSSDDGEPQGTAGHPILDILMGEKLSNALAIVTRYFGGTLLGTGGLVNAYSDSVKEALKKAKMSEVVNGYEIDLIVNYDNYNKIFSEINNINFVNENEKYITKKIETVPNIIELKKDFAEKVSLKYLVKTETFDRFSFFIKNLTKGEIILEKKKDDGRKYFWKNLQSHYIW